MAIISRGFAGRRSAAEGKLPPGQYLTTDFPVLSAGPTPPITVDIHCVTRWSKLGTTWEGVSLDVLLADVRTDLSYTMFRSYGDYTTNLPLKDVVNKQAWIAFKFNDADLEPEHGGPARLLVPHLYFWKSAKWVRGLTLMPQDKPGFWEGLGYHIYGDPWLEQRYSDQ
jgi:DMSO/TMAO reductase YedYZ molybdopterin-dependent catalytic subunit